MANQDKPTQPDTPKSGGANPLNEDEKKSRPFTVQDATQLISAITALVVALAALNKSCHADERSSQATQTARGATQTAAGATQAAARAEQAVNDLQWRGAIFDERDRILRVGQGRLLGNCLAPLDARETWNAYCRCMIGRECSADSNLAQVADERRVMCLRQERVCVGGLELSPSCTGSNNVTLSAMIEYLGRCPQNSVRVAAAPRGMTTEEALRQCQNIAALTSGGVVCGDRPSSAGQPFSWRVEVGENMAFCACPLRP